MLRLRSWIRSFYVDEVRPALADYGLVVPLFIVVSILAFKLLGTEVVASMQEATLGL